MNILVVANSQNPEEIIEKAARTCYATEPNESKRSDFITRIIRLGHESVLEHASITYRLEGVSRALTHQLVRHRIASYSQKSQRYVKETQFEYVLPPKIQQKEMSIFYDMTMKKIQKLYNTMIGHGVPAEDARYILPNACTTDIVVTMNFRELRHFFELRCEKHSQWEIRECANKMLEKAFNISPIVFKDLKERFMSDKNDT